MYHHAGGLHTDLTDSVMVKATPVKVFTVSRLDGKVKPSVHCYVDVGGEA